MSNPTTRPIPLLGSISLEYVQAIEHSLDSGFFSTTLPGLDGEYQQRASRASHRIFISGILFGDGAMDNLKALQAAAADGNELTFSADITSSLDFRNVVVNSFKVQEEAARPGQYYYEIGLIESPTLPPPAQAGGFGGLDDFGMGDLGFDTDIMGELSSLAGDLGGALDSALGVIDQLDDLLNLGDFSGLSVDGIFSPIMDAGKTIEPASTKLKGALKGLSDLLG